MVKHTQTIRRLLPKNCLSAFDQFLELVLKGLTLAQQMLPTYRLYGSMFPSYRNQSINLLYKSIDWFLYDMNTDQ